MKSIVKEIPPGVTVATVLAITSVSFLSLQSPVAAQPQEPSLTPQQTQIFLMTCFPQVLKDFFGKNGSIWRQIEIFT